MIPLGLSIILPIQLIDAGSFYPIQLAWHWLKFLLPRNDKKKRMKTQPLETSAGTNFELSNSSSGPTNMVGGDGDSGLRIIRRLGGSVKIFKKQIQI